MRQLVALGESNIRPAGRLWRVKLLQPDGRFAQMHRPSPKGALRARHRAWASGFSCSASASAKRAALRCRASSALPAPSLRTRAALSGWSHAKGNTSCGVPAAKARAVVPMPPWCTTAAHKGSSSWKRGECHMAHRARQRRGQLLRMPGQQHAAPASMPHAWTTAWKNAAPCLMPVPRANEIGGAWARQKSTGSVVSFEL
jgi:hypothetical protein